MGEEVEGNKEINETGADHVGALPETGPTAATDATAVTAADAKATVVAAATGPERAAAAGCAGSRATRSAKRPVGQWRASTSCQSALNGCMMLCILVVMILCCFFCCGWLR